MASEGGVLAFLSGVDRRIFDDVYVPLADVFDVVVLTPFDTHRHTHTHGPDRLLHLDHFHRRGRAHRI